MGCGGGTNTSTSSSQPPQWLQNNLQSLYTQAQNVTGQPLQQYQAPLVEGFSPTQNAAMNTVNQAQGLSVPYTNQAANYINAGTQPVLNSVQQFSPDAVSQYQSPYTQQVINATQQQLNQNDAVQQQQLLGGAIQAGASPFGGDRAGIAAAALAGQQDLANNQTIAGLENSGYTQALGELNNQQQLQLSGTTAGDWLNEGAAAQESGLGTTAQNNALSGASAQLQTGALQQQLGQEQLNIPYEQYLQQQSYPYQNLSALESAAGVAGGLAGGTSSTTSPAPSALSQVAGLGAAGLGAYLAFAPAAAAAADGGRIAHRDMGGNVPLPNVPDVSLSYISGTGNNTVRSNAPKPPSTQGAGTASALSPASLGKTLGAGIGKYMGGAGSGAGSDPSIGARIQAFLGGNTPSANALAGTEVTPSAMSQLENGGMSDTDFGNYLDDIQFHRGGIAHRASGGAGLTLPQIPNEANGYISVTANNSSAPQLNLSALNGSNTTASDYFNPLPQISNTQPTYTPQAITSPQVSQGVAPAPAPAATAPTAGLGTPVASSAPMGAAIAPATPIASTPAPAPATAATPSYQATPAKTIYQSSLTPQQLQAVQRSATGETIDVNGNNYTWNTGDPMGQWTLAKIGGAMRHYDLGGPVATDPTQAALQGANPNTQNYYKQISALPPEKLQELALQVPPNTPQGKLVQSALQQKRMNPQAGLGAAPTLQTPPGGAPSTLGMSRGGIGHYADGGNDAQDFLTTLSQAAPQLDPDGGPDNQARDYSQGPSGYTPADIEAQKDPDTKVDHSGDTVVVRHPSNGEAIDLGIPSQKDPKDAQFQKWEPLIAAGLGTMAGTSPFASVNIGRGGLEGLKAYNENRASTREEAQQQAQQTNQQGELAARNREISQTGAYQQGVLRNTAQRNSAEAQHWQAMEGLAKMKFNNGIPSFDPETGDVIPGSQTAAAQANGFGFPVQPIPPQVFHAMSSEDSKRKQLENNNFPVANNVMRILDQLEPNLNNFQTGSYAPGVRATAGKFFGTDGGTAAANIEKGTNDLATELGKFQYTPGQRGSVLGLQTILASKPGIQQPQQTNQNIINSLRAKVTDYTLSSELNEQYREASPYKITDSNTQELDRALKSAYPIEQIDPKTGVTKFNRDNAQKIRDAIPDAIANPQKYFSIAKQNAQAGTGAGVSPQQQQLSNNTSGSKQQNSPTSSGLPPLAARVKGQSYSTPTGNRNWLGNGWSAPQ